MKQIIDTAPLDRPLFLFNGEDALGLCVFDDEFGYWADFEDGAPVGKVTHWSEPAESQVQQARDSANK